MDLQFDLHPGQLKIFESKKRFTLTVAGRRWGKSRLSAVKLLIEGLKETNEWGYPIEDKDVYYIAPTFQQAKDTMWRQIKSLGHGIIHSTLENTGIIRLKNGRQIHLKGSDKPDTLRGVGLSFVVLDEYATMKPETWEEIIRPTLTDVKGKAMFIGTPRGKNHFYQLYLEALQYPDDWDVFEFKTSSNPFLDPAEIELARNSMSHEGYRQEYEATFASGGGQVFTEDMITTGPELEDGEWYMSFDPAGYTEVHGKIKSKLKRLDESALAIVKVGTDGWYVHDILTGRWGIREASLKILNACRNFHPLAVGIERGALKNAILPYMQDQMKRLSVFPRIVDTTHGGKKKADRIAWSLQGRMQHGRITFRDAPYLIQLKDQLLDFPNPMAHDDMIDALAYIDQVSTVSYFHGLQQPEWKPLDLVAGY